MPKLKAEVVVQSGFREYYAVKISGIGGLYIDSVILRLSQSDYAMLQEGDRTAFDLLETICKSVNGRE